MQEPILVTRSSMPPLEEYIEEIRTLWDTHFLTNMGPKHQEFQARVKDYLGVQQIDLLTNGHMALELSMQALGLTGEVITTPFTFASTTQAIVRNGLKPVFCDVNPRDFTIDTDKIEELVTEKTSAIVPVHVYGNICDVEGIERIAKKYGLKVLYDAAHCFGVRYKDRGIGNFGDVSCFSFHATKVFNTIEGGAVCFHHHKFGEKLRALKNFGLSDGTAVELGANAKMNEFCAAMGLCNLRHIDEEMEKRKSVVERYRAHLDGINGLQLSPIQKDVTQNYAYFPVVFDKTAFGANRDQVMQKLSEENIFARKYFYPLTSAFPCYGGRYDSTETPVALRLSQQVLTLPLYADLDLKEVDRICEIVLGCKR